MARPKDTTTIDHLVIALLSVGGYPLQRTWDRLEKIQAAGLTSTEVVAALDEAEVVRRLAAAGYDRGPDVTTSMAKRLLALHEAARKGAVEEAKRLLGAGKEKEAQEKLCRIKGVGAAVFTNFLALERE